MNKITNRLANAVKRLFVDLPGEKIFPLKHRDCEKRENPGLIAVIGADGTFHNSIEFWVPPYPNKWKIPEPNLPLFIVLVDALGTDWVLHEDIGQVNPKITPRRAYAAGVLVDMITDALVAVDRAIGNNTWIPRDWWVEVRNNLLDKKQEKK